MKKKLIVLALSVLFLLPTASYAATLDEQKTAIISQLIHLLQLQIAELQAQLAYKQTSPVLGTVATSTEIYVCHHPSVGC